MGWPAERIADQRKRAEDLIAIVIAEPEGRDFAVVQLPGLNHLLQPARSGLPIEYASIPVTISPLALTTIGDWLAARVIR